MQKQKNITLIGRCNAMKNISKILFVLLCFSYLLIAQTQLEIGDGMVVETSGGAYVVINGDLHEVGTGYFKGKISSGDRTGLTSFAGLTLSTGIDGSITRTTGSAYAKGNGEGTNFLRYYEVNNNGSMVTTDMQVSFIFSGDNDERNSLTDPYYVYRRSSNWNGYGEEELTSPVTVSGIHILSGLTDWVISDDSFILFTDSEVASTGTPIQFNESGEGGDGHEVEITFSDLAGSGNVTVQQTNRAPSNLLNNHCLTYFWGISKDAGITAFTSDVSFTYLDDDLLDVSESRLVPAYYDEVQSKWTFISDFALNESSNTITINDLDHFSTFAIGEPEAFNFGIYNIQVNTNWNMIGLPLEVDNGNYLDLFPNAIPNTLYGFDGAYVLYDTLRLTEGYWLRFSADEAVNIVGYPVDSSDLVLGQGWNMISGISCDVALSDVSDPGNIIIPGTLYGFEHTYVLSDSIKQGKGYWIRTSQSGQISLACATEATQPLAKAPNKNLDSDQVPVIQFNDPSGVRKALYPAVRLENEKDKLSYSMPPVPPSGIFDVRFSGDYRICEGEEAIIQVQSSNYPLTISASNISLEEGFQYEIKEIIGGEEGKTYILDKDNTIEITNPGVKTLKLSKEKIIPLTFMVQQNYPNPFNPETVIKYSIPQNEKVEMVIYNTLGQKVKTLVSKNKEAGFYEVLWDATNDYGNTVGSGIYFYRVRAGKHVAIKKMVLLR